MNWFGVQVEPSSVILLGLMVFIGLALVATYFIVSAISKQRKRREQAESLVCYDPISDQEVYLVQTEWDRMRGRIWSMRGWDTVDGSN